MHESSKETIASSCTAAAASPWQRTPKWESWRVALHFLRNYSALSSCHVLSMICLYHSVQETLLYVMKQFILVLVQRLLKKR